MKVFVTGSTGLLGSALLRLAPKGVKLFASYNKVKLVPKVHCSYHNVDITKKTLVNRVLSEVKPDVIIHTAALATPDYCDKHHDEAWSVNVNGTKNLLKAAQKHNSKFIFVSTNGVFDGKKPPYDETAQPKPIDFYGKTKYEGEKLVQNSGTNYTLVRLITMYGWNNPKERQNPATWLLKILGENKTPVNMVTDMFNNFLYNEEAAKGIWKTLDQKYSGETFHIAGKDCISRFDFSVQIAERFKLDSTMIYPVPLSFFKNFVARPKNTCFVTDKAKRVLNLPPLSSKKGLLHMHQNPLLTTAFKEI